MAFSFFNWIISLITGRKAPERARQRVLKRMTKVLTANRYGNFYLTKTDEATPELAKFFFSIYKVISPAQALLQNADQSTQLKMATILTFLDKNQFALLEQLFPENIELRAQEMSYEDIARQLQDDCDSLEKAFDEDRTRAINDCYSLIMVMAKFVSYDFYFLLKKFDNQLSERSVAGKPRFLPVQGQVISDMLKDFLEITGGIDTDQDWDTGLRVLKSFKGVDVVNPKLWHSMLLKIWDVKQSGILEMMIRFINKDPDWGWEPKVPRENITDPYLETIRLETFERLTRITTARQKARIIECARTVFGDIETEQLNYYTETNSEIYEKKNFPGFTFARGLNYLKLFLNDENEHLQFLSDLILIRGQWVSRTLSHPLLESVQTISDLPEKIKWLDDSLSDTGSYGSKLKNTLMKVDGEGRGKSQTRFIRSNLENLNNDAKRIITDAIFNFSVLADSLKDLLEDYRRSISIIILNWGELEPFSEGSLETQISRIHKKLISILQLLRLIVQNFGETEEDED
jgi:hypothetical protein